MPDEIITDQPRYVTYRERPEYVMCLDCRTKISAVLVHVDETARHDATVHNPDIPEYGPFARLAEAVEAARRTLEVAEADAAIQAAYDLFEAVAPIQSSDLDRLIMPMVAMRRRNDARRAGS